MTRNRRVSVHVYVCMCNRSPLIYFSNYSCACASARRVWLSPRAMDLPFFMQKHFYLITSGQGKKKFRISPVYFYNYRSYIRYVGSPRFSIFNFTI